MTNGFPVPVKIYVSGMKEGGLTCSIGQDNTSTECIVGDVPNIFDGDLSDHDGPYNGVTMGCSS